MGCDIHCYVEYTEKEGTIPLDDWQCFGGKINPGRHYSLFGMLAGVRCGTAIFKPRGLPETYSHEVRFDHLIYVSESGADNTISSVRAEQLVQLGASKYAEAANGNKKGFITNPDHHSHSYLSLKEYVRVLNIYEKKFDDGEYSAPPEYYAIKASMMEFEKMGYAVRLVFWFDN